MQSAVRAVVAEGGDGNLQGAERHPSILTEPSGPRLAGAVCAADGGSAATLQQGGFALGLHLALLRCRYTVFSPSAFLTSTE